MHTLHSNGKTLLLVEVPMDAYDLIICRSRIEASCGEFDAGYDWFSDVFDVTGCNVIGLLRELKPEQVEGYVEKFMEGFAVYTVDGKKSECFFTRKPLRSFNGLLQSHNIDPSLNFLLIEKVN